MMSIGWFRTASSKQSVAGSIVDINVFKSALKSPLAMERQHLSAATLEEDFGNAEIWRTINRLPLPMAILSRYL